jgi:hypothetical protein
VSPTNRHVLILRRRDPLRGTLSLPGRARLRQRRRQDAPGLTRIAQEATSMLKRDICVVIRSPHSHRIRPYAGGMNSAIGRSNRSSSPGPKNRPGETRMIPHPVWKGAPPGRQPSSTAAKRPYRWLRPRGPVGPSLGW